jgi:hypothetical protein
MLTRILVFGSGWLGLQMSNATTELSTTRTNVRAKVVKGRGGSQEE